MSFLSERFSLNTCYEIFYFILVWRRLKSIKLEKSFFFLPTSNKFAIQYNPLMQLILIFQKTNQNSDKFKVLVDLAVSQQLRKLWKEGGGKFILFWSLFFAVHINFQYKLKYHTSLFIVTFYLFSSISLLIFYHLPNHCFFSLIFDYKFNEFSHWQCLICVLFQFKKEQKLTSKINKPKNFPFKK